MTTTMPIKIKADSRRQTLWTAHRNWMDRCWDSDGHYVNEKSPNTGGYRAMLWHCMAYLDGDAHHIERANRIIQTNFTDKPCHFTPNATIDLLIWHRQKLDETTLSLLKNNLRMNLSYACTEDLKIHGYNDNHPYKAMHALVLGGEILNDKRMVQIGLAKLKQAVAFFAHAGFPCEYNSPTYSFVSLVPLAGIVEHTRHPEARELALKLERFYWQDVALHFDARVGLPAGPFARGYASDYEAMLCNTTCLLAYLFPEQFAFDLLTELYDKGYDSQLIAPAVKDALPFVQAHMLFASATDFHLTPKLIQTLFEPRTNTTVKGIIESGTASIRWPDETDKPDGAPSTHHMGPRRSLITTWFGKNSSLGTAQYAWLNNTQAHGCIANIARENRRHPAANARYFSRFFLDDHCPYVYPTHLTPRFYEEAETRTVQHEMTAMVFYNPLPIHGRITQMRTGIFRPIRFNQPLEMRVDNTSLTHFNHIFDKPLTVTINEETAYVGIIPLRQTDHGQSCNAALQIMTRGDHLSILYSSLQDWSARDMSYDQIIQTHAGYIMEVHDADAFESFDDFCKMLGQATVNDNWYADMRTTQYTRPGLTLASCYSPWQSAFGHVSINGKAMEEPLLAVNNMTDPGCDLLMR